MARALDHEGNAYARLDDSVRNFANQAASVAVLCGKAMYELAYEYELPRVQDDKPIGFRLLSLTPGTVGRIRGQLVQFVPAGTLNAHQSWRGAYLPLGKAEIVAFRIPSPLRKAARRLVSFLRVADTQENYQLQLDQMASGGALPYNFGMHQEIRSELFARASRNVGWSARGLFRENHLETFDIWRQITFLEFKVRMRDEIVQNLNELLERVGQVMNFQATIEVTNVPSLGDVEALRAGLESGTLGLSKIARDSV